MRKQIPVLPIGSLRESRKLTEDLLRDPSCSRTAPIVRDGTVIWIEPMRPASDLIVSIGNDASSYRTRQAVTENSEMPFGTTLRSSCVMSRSKSLSMSRMF
jgi:hypothetical protein